VTITRTGFTDARGREHVLGYFRWEAPPPGSWLGRAHSEHVTGVRIAQRLHGLSRAATMAKAKGVQPVMQEPSVRQSLARSEMTQIAAAEQRLGKIADEAFMAKQKMMTEAFAPPGVAAAVLATELRAFLRAAPDEQRARLMRSHEYRLAALSAPAELSGLSQEVRDILRDEHLRTLHPAEMEELDVAAEAIAETQTTLKSAWLAVEAELSASGATVAEPSEAPAEAAWA
jgi:hypothetical protein